MASNVQVDTDVHELQLVLRGMGLRVRRLGQLMPAVAEALGAAVDDVFDAEGPGWEELKPATLAHRRKQGRGAKILQDTGQSAALIGTGYGQDFAEARAGTDYLIYHVTGTKHLPVRNPFDLGPFEEPLLKEVEQMVFDEVEKG